MPLISCNSTKPLKKTQVLINMMHSTILVDVDEKKEYVRLENDGWIPRWLTNRERMFQINSFTLAKFKAEFEQVSPDLELLKVSEEYLRSISYIVRRNAPRSTKGLADPRDKGLKSSAKTSA